MSVPEKNIFKTNFPIYSKIQQPNIYTTLGDEESSKEWLSGLLLKVTN